MSALLPAASFAAIYSLASATTSRPSVCVHLTNDCEDNHRQPTGHSAAERCCSWSPGNDHEEEEEDHQERLPPPLAVDDRSPLLGQPSQHSEMTVGNTGG
jgi:hypothetical protein